jgi:hypothetical protein
MPFKPAAAAAATAAEEVAVVQEPQQTTRPRRTRGMERKEWKPFLADEQQPTADALGPS